MKRELETRFLFTFLLIFSTNTSGQALNPAYEDYLDSSPKVLGSSSPPTVATERGKLTRLKCFYHSQPEPKIHWLMKGKEVRHDCDTCISSVKNEPDSKASFLDITPYEDEDFGVYECRIRNKYGSAKLKILLKKSDTPQTKCQKERATSNDPRRRHEFRPVCNEDGSYHKVQCSVELTTCWCVNQYGKKTLDVVDGANGLQCFQPKDLSVVAIFVLTQGLVLTLVMIDQFFNIYTGYSVIKVVQTFCGRCTRARNKGYKLLTKEERKWIKMRPLPPIPAQKSLKNN